MESTFPPHTLRSGTSQDLHRLHRGYYTHRSRPSGRETREQDTGNRIQGTGYRERGTGNRIQGTRFKNQANGTRVFMN